MADIVYVSQELCQLKSPIYVHHVYCYMYTVISVRVSVVFLHFGIFSLDKDTCPAEPGLL